MFRVLNFASHLITFHFKIASRVYLYFIFKSFRVKKSGHVKYCLMSSFISFNYCTSNVALFFRSSLNVISILIICINVVSCQLLFLRWISFFVLSHFRLIIVPCHVRVYSLFTF